MDRSRKALDPQWLAAFESFMARKAHDMRATLNSIIGFSSFLLEGKGEPLTENQLLDLQVIRNQAHSLANQINALVEVGKIEAGLLGRNDLDFQRIDLKRIAGPVIDALGAQAQEKAVQLTCHIPTDLPVLWADPYWVVWVIRELLTNAVRATKEGEITLAVTTEADQIRTEITDTGPGIPLHIQEAFLADGDSVVLYSLQAHAGCGLSICRMMVEMHGGSISLECGRDAGSVVTFSLPVDLNKPAYRICQTENGFEVHRTMDKDPATSRVYETFPTRRDASDYIKDRMAGTE